MACHFAGTLFARQSWNWTAGMRILPQLRSICSASSSPRFNPVEIQMLSKSLHDQIFWSECRIHDNKAIDKAKEHLDKHGLWGKSGTVLPDVSFQLPTLYGSNIDEHFCEIARKQSKSYFEKAQMLSECNLPKMPSEWNFAAGLFRW